MPTLDELMQEYEPERLAQIAKDDTPEARARSEAKRADQLAREIRQGLRTADGDWIEQLVEEAEDADDEEDDLDD